MSKSRLMSTMGAVRRSRRESALFAWIVSANVTVMPDHFVGTAMTVGVRMRSDVVLRCVLRSPQRTVGMHNALGVYLERSSANA